MFCTSQSTKAKGRRDRVHRASAGKNSTPVMAEENRIAGAMQTKIGTEKTSVARNRLSDLYSFSNRLPRAQKTGAEEDPG